MLIERLEDQWICSCGNWVDHAFVWCPDCCQEREREDFPKVDEREATPFLHNAMP